MPRSAASRRVDLQRFDGTRIAVELNLAGVLRTVCGFAEYETDPVLGNVLRIAVDVTHESGSTEILISESEWTGEIVRGVDFDCDYCFKPTNAA